jgi:hypothetical protein
MAEGDTMTTDDAIYARMKTQVWRLLQPNCMWRNGYGGCQQRSGGCETTANLYGKCDKRSCPVLKQAGRKGEG